jgi:HupE / UreJ protein
VRACALAGLALLLAGAAAGHPLAPSLLELEESGDGRVVARFTVPRLAVGRARVAPVLPARCRALGPAALRGDETRLVSELALDCGPDGLAGAEIGAQGLAETRTDLIVRAVRAGGAPRQALLTAARPTLRLPDRGSAAQVLADYARMGASHLAGGLDHLLFVAGLFLLVPGTRRRIGTLTAFTLGHSATLSLVALGIASPPALAVDLGIAASLVALGAELAAGGRGPLAERPWLMSGGFGLLHGMGFAGALRQVGLPDGAVPLALFSFNAGIELAQLAAVAVLAAASVPARALLRASPRPAAALACHAIGGLGAFLFLERLTRLVAP